MTVVVDKGGDLELAEVAEKLHWRLFRIAALMRRREQGQVAAGALSMTQCSMLYALQKHGPYRVSELAAYEGVTLPTTTLAVRRLEGLGLVARTRDLSDHRIVWIKITREGVAAQRKAVADLLGAMLEALDPTEIAALEVALEPLERLAVASNAAEPSVDA